MYRYILITVTTGLIIILAFSLLYSPKDRVNQGDTYAPLERVVQQANGSLQASLSQIQAERNELSKRANVLMKEYMQYNCKKETGRRVSQNGGWCEQQSPIHRTDEHLARGLAELFQGKAVGSFGDGDGAYKRVIDETGLVKQYDSFDGAPFCEEQTNKTTTYLDLTIPAFGLPVYDWILSLEVAEHIPTAHEPTFVDNVIRHAKEGIVISWAVPGQGGVGHINCRSHQYVIDLFASLDFRHCEDEGKRLKKVTKLPWLRDNVLVFRRNVQMPLSDMVMHA